MSTTTYRRFDDHAGVGGAAAASVTPHDLDAERALLGACLIAPDGYARVAGQLDSQDFFRDAHQRIYAAFRAVARQERALDAVTVADELSRAGDLDHAGGVAYISALTDGVPRSSNVEHYAEIVVEHARRRRIVAAANRLAAAGAANSEDVDHLRAAIDAQGRSRRKRRSVRAIELVSAPRPLSIIEGIATAGATTVVVGESGAGKSFALTDWAAHVDAGIPWHGRLVEQGSSVIFAFERDDIGLRLRGLHEAHGHLLQHVHIVRMSEPLSPRVTREGEERSIGELAAIAELEAIGKEVAANNEPPIRLVGIDTVRASMTGNEDSSEHVSAFLRSAGRIAACAPEAAMVLIHHAGWQDGETQKKRERGSSAWRGNVDTTLYLERGDYDRDRGVCQLTLRTLKTRDGEPAPPLHIIRRRIELDELDRHGRPLSTCVIERDCRTREDREAAEQQAADAEARALDLRVLRLMAEKPDTATSQDRIRLALGLKRDITYAAIARVIDRGWAAPPERQRLPYIITPAGRAALGQAPQV